jgi:aryl-alcohol dehydrogenase-like predicted oxidoreductase
LVILTKCFFPLTDNPLSARIFPNEANSRDYINKKGLSRKHIFEAVEASLKRLQTEYIDVLQVHRYDYDTPREETTKALHGIIAQFNGDIDLVEMGKVRYIGTSSMHTYQFLGMQHIADKNGWTKFVSMQNYYNLIYREDEQEMPPACKELGVG